MVSPLVTVLLLVLGIALCAGGYLFFTEAFYLLGFLAGLSIGLVALGHESIPGQWDLAILIVAPILGLALAASIRVLAIAVFGALIGFAIGLVATGVSVPPIANLVNPILVACVVGGAITAFFLETPIMMFASASWGATLLTIVLGGSLFQGGTPEAALTNGLPMLFWVFFVVGLGIQVGVWYYLRTHLDDDQTLKGVVFRHVGRQVGSLRN